MHLIITSDKVTVVDDNNVSTEYQKPLKRLVKDNPELTKHFGWHLIAGVQ